MLKILHTSDWHLGHQLYGYDRTEEQTAMLVRMADIVRSERPDVFLVAGDVFHVSQPSAAVQRLFVEHLLRIREACPGMEVIVTAGNHDSASRHEIFRVPWQALGVRMVGVLDGDNPGEHIVEVPGKGYVVAVPYINERFIPEGFLQRLLDTVAERNAGRLPVVMSAHTTVRGADFSGHERIRDNDWLIGGIDGVEIEAMGEGYDYLALGHIHRGQFVLSRRGGSDRSVRYSGAPLAVSFDEAFPHSVSVVEISSRGAVPEVRTVEIADIRPLVNVPASGFADWETALGCLREIPPALEAYVRLNVEQAESLPAAAADLARSALKGKKVRFCNINFRRVEKDPSARSPRLSLGEFKAVHPVEVARRFVEERGDTFDAEMEEMLREVVRLTDIENPI